MKTYIIEMPEEGNPLNCEACILDGQVPHCNIPHWSDCPLANAKEAKLASSYWHGDNNTAVVDGKDLPHSFKIYAVEEK